MGLPQTVQNDSETTSPMRKTRKENYFRFKAVMSESEKSTFFKSEVKHVIDHFCGQCGTWFFDEFLLSEVWLVVCKHFPAWSSRQEVAFRTGHPCVQLAEIDWACLGQLQSTEKTRLPHQERSRKTIFGLLLQRRKWLELTGIKQ